MSHSDTSSRPAANNRSTKPESSCGPITLFDVAQLAGTSKGTASRALNGKHWVAPATREAVLKAASELGFHADPTARRLRNGRCDKLIGLFTRALDLGVVTRKCQMLQDALNAKGYEAPIHACGSVSGEGTQQAQAMASLCRQKPAAVICYTLGLHDATLRVLQEYLAGGGVAVCYDTPFEMKSNTADYVVFDRADNTYQAARHLVQLGHQKIGLFSSGHAHDPDRLLGFKRALREGGLTMQAAMSFFSAPLQDSEQLSGSEHIGQKLGEYFLSLDNRPTAMCITDDYVAAGFVAALHRKGLKVPEEVSVVGHDDMPVAAHSCVVPLTTVSQPVQSVVDECVRLVDSRLSGAYTGSSRRVTVCGELIERQSTGVPAL